MDGGESQGPSTSAPFHWTMMPADSGLQSRSPVLFLDFDGTLAPIAPSPELVRLDPVEIDLLESLARMIPVFIISGRAFSDIVSRVPVSSLAGISGDHGAVRRFGEHVHLHPEAVGSQEALDKWAPRLRDLTNSFPGAFVEIKDFSVSIHFRRLPETDVPPLQKAIGALFSAWKDQDKFRISPGKMVWEIRPVRGVTKEDTMEFFLDLLARESDRKSEYFVPVMIGDDMTDLAAVHYAAAVGGWGCWVGETPNFLEPHVIRLSNPMEVWKRLDRLRSGLKSGNDPIHMVRAVLTQ